MSPRSDPFRCSDRLASEILGDDQLLQPMPTDCCREGDTFVLHFDLAAEHPSGAYARHLFVGTDFDLASITAGYRDGILTLRMPVAGQVQPREISVDHDEGSNAALPAGGSRGRSLAAEAIVTLAAEPQAGVATA